MAGLAPEVLPGDRNLLALGGSGFGVMALLVGAERQFVTRDQAVERLFRPGLDARGDLRVVHGEPRARVELLARAFELVEEQRVVP